MVRKNEIVMYSTQNEGKPAVTERFIRTLKTKIYKYMALISKNEYNNKYHRTIKMKPVDVKNNTYIDFGKKVNDKDPKFKVGNHIRISKYKNIFTKGYTPNWSEEVFVIKEVFRKTLFHGRMLLVILMVKTLLKHFKRIAKNKSRITYNRKSN